MLAADDLIEPPSAVKDTLIQGRKVGKERTREVGLCVITSRALGVASIVNSIERKNAGHTSSVTFAWTAFPWYSTVTIFPQ